LLSAAVVASFATTQSSDFTIATDITGWILSSQAELAIIYYISPHKSSF